MDELSQLRKEIEKLQRENRSLKRERDELSSKYNDLEYQNKILNKSNAELQRELEQEKKLRIEAEKEQFTNNWYKYTDEQVMIRD